MLLKIVGFLVMLPSVFWLIFTNSSSAAIWLLIGGCIYYLGFRSAERTKASAERYACPQCAEQVLRAAKLCPHCHTPLTPQD